MRTVDKYPTHSVMAKKKPKYSGSGSLTDRFKAGIVANVAPDAAGRGAGGMRIVHRSGAHRSETNSRPGEKNFGPGKQDNRTMKMGETHGFCAHAVTKKGGDKNSQLRFSGNEGAHRVGLRKGEGGRFHRGNIYTAGLTFNGEGKDRPAGGDIPLNPGRSKDNHIQKGNIKQPKKGSGSYKGYGERGQK